MADDRKPDPRAPSAPAAYSDESAELKRKLVKRMAVAGLLIAALLGGLAVIDRLLEMDEAEEPGPPPITRPVPVPQKEIAGAVTPPAPPAPMSVVPPEPPPQPEVAAQPSLPPAAPATAPSVAPPRVIASRPLAPAPAAVPEASSAPLEAGMPSTPLPPALKPVPETAVPAVAKPALPRPGRGYVVQAGVFASADLAQELHAKLVLNGIPSSLETRVHVGPFTSQREAEVARAKLKALGIDGLLIPPRGRR